VTGVVHMDLTTLPIMVSGTLIPERNGLPQFNEDTGKPSVPVREFNLIACPLA